MFKALLLENTFKDCGIIERKLEELGKLTVFDRIPENTDIPEVHECDAIIIVNQLHADKELIDRLDNCKMIIRSGVGYDNVDVAYASSKGIYVANVPDYCADEVSDHAVAMLLAMERRLLSADRSFRETRRYRLDALRGIRGLRGRTAGIIGLGNTGRLTAKKLDAFGMDVIYYHPRRSCDVEMNGFTVKWCGLEELFKKSDYLILHAPANEETYHIVNAHTLSLMKKEAGIVNVARGELIDTEALNRALEGGGIACAALDVFEGSLKTDANRELFDRPNTVLTPHSAWLSENSDIRLLEIIGENLADAAKGRPPRNCINADRLAPRNDR